MLPEGFIKRILTQDYIDSELLLRSLDEPSPVSIRINRMKWQKKPSGSENVPWASDAYHLAARPSFTFDPLFNAGCYYPQEASGMFLEKVLDQYADKSQNLKVLDLCGAPGGKSTHLSSLLGDNGLLVSNEVIASRANVLSETLTKWGRSNFIVTQSDPSVFRHMTGYFDVIVVDAPCSGEGMFRTPIARAEWSEANTLHCSERQKRILQDVWPSLKENGLLIYSTCTFNPIENEMNIKWLASNREALSLSIDIKPYTGITEIDYNGIKGYGFYPGKVRGEGFFISVLRKTEHSGTVSPVRIKNDLRKISKNEIASLVKDFRTDESRLVKWNDLFISLPCLVDDYMILREHLKIIKHGTVLGSFKTDNLLPHHDVALSQLLVRERYPGITLSYDEAIAYLRRDSLAPVPAEKGWNLAVYEGVPLGWIKNIGTRINNYYPVEWRIRMQKSAPGITGIISWE